MFSENENISKLSDAIMKIRRIKLESNAGPKHSIDELTLAVNDIRSVLAHEIGEVFKSFSGYRCENMNERKTLANGFNALLSATGLSIKCPKTGRPSRLIARVGTSAPNGHFQIEHRGSPPCVALSSVGFPNFELIPSESDGRIHYKNGQYTKGL